MKNSTNIPPRFRGFHSISSPRMTITKVRARNISQPPVPSIIYTYLSAQHAIESLRNRRLKLCDADRANDLFEFNWNILLECTEHMNEEERYELRKWLIYAFQKETAARMKFISFSATRDNLLLWSYYGDNSRGVCLGFSGKLRADAKIPVRPVIYAPPVDIQVRDSIKNNAEDLEERLSRFFLTKKQKWSHESEWRMLVPVGSKNVVVERNTHQQQLSFWGFPPRYLKEVIFGAGCSKDDINLIRTECLSFQPRPQFFQVVCDYDTFEPLVQPLPDEVSSLT